MSKAPSKKQEAATAAAAATASASADTTLGGVKKAKFVPNVASSARRRKPGDAAAPRPALSTDTIDLVQQAQREAAKARQRANEGGKPDHKHDGKGGHVKAEAKADKQGDGVSRPAPSSKRELTVILDDAGLGSRSQPMDVDAVPEVQGPSKEPYAPMTLPFIPHEAQLHTVRSSQNEAKSKVKHEERDGNGVVKNEAMDIDRDLSAPAFVRVQSDTASRLHDIETTEDDLLFFQLPSHLPLRQDLDPESAKLKQAAKLEADLAEVKEHEEELMAMAETVEYKIIAQKQALSAKLSRLFSVNAEHALSQLPAGQLGKLLLYKSGKVKLQLGEVLLDVELGTNCGFRQEVLSFSPAAKQVHSLGTIGDRFICTVAVDPSEALP